MGLCIVRMPSGLDCSQIMSSNGAGQLNNGYEMGGEMDVNYNHRKSKIPEILKIYTLFITYFFRWFWQK